MKKKNLKKLTLSKNTISKLHKEQLDSVKGGIHYSCFPTCTTTALYSACGNLHCY